MKYWVFCLGMVWMLVSCTGQMPKTNIAPVNENWAERFHSYEVREINIDYSAQCRIMVTTVDDSMNGSCQMTITHTNQVRITIFSPVGGTVADLYADQDEIRLIDPSKKTVYIMVNNQENRKRIPGFPELSVEDFQSIFWGRKIDGKAGEIQFDFKDDKPYRVHNIGSSHMVVTYRSWLEYRHAWFPKKLQFEDDKNKIKIRMVITEFQPGLSSDIKITRIPDGYRISP